MSSKYSKFLTGLFCVPELSWTDFGGLFYTGDPTLLIAQVLGIAVIFIAAIVMATSILMSPNRDLPAVIAALILAVSLAVAAVPRRCLMASPEERVWSSFPPRPATGVRKPGGCSTALRPCV